MKKIILLLTIFAGFALTSEAQLTKTITLVSAVTGATVDTVDNTETLYLALPSTANIASFYKGGTVVFKAHEISGDGSGAVATLQVSANGTDFADAPVQYTADTSYTLANVTTAQTYSWRLFNVAIKAARIKVVGAGTMSYKIYGAVFLAN